MTHLELIKQLDKKPNCERRNVIIDELNKLGIDFHKQEYRTGTNLIVHLGNAKNCVGISSHFDKVENAGGANDNGAAIAVCIDIIRKFKQSSSGNSGLSVFFFDEEETGLKGSKAYVHQYGIRSLSGLINMELVGLGDKFALWSVNKTISGSTLTAFEETAAHMNIATQRFDRIVTNSADHISFRNAGLIDCFTVTCISDQDIETASHYYKALEFNVDKETLNSILSTAPIFQHYHQPTDTYEKLSESTIAMTSSTIWNTILTLENKRK